MFVTYGVGNINGEGLVIVQQIQVGHPDQLTKFELTCPCDLALDTPQQANELHEAIALWGVQFFIIDPAALRSITLRGKSLLRSRPNWTRNLSLPTNRCPIYKTVQANARVPPQPLVLEFPGQKSQSPSSISPPTAHVGQVAVFGVGRKYFVAAAQDTRVAIFSIERCRTPSPSAL